MKGFQGEKAIIVDAQYEQWRRIPSAAGYRLPTEAEWELACRAGTITPFSCADHEQALDNGEELLKKYAKFGPPFDLCVTGSLMPNGWGLFEMHGNAVEWCQDLYARYPLKEFLSDPRGPTNKDLALVNRVWGGIPNHARTVESGSRHLAKTSPHTRTPGSGFRLARSAHVEHSNSLGLNMQINRGLENSVGNPVSRHSEKQTVTITRPFLISDAEVSVGEFRKFIDDIEYRKKFPEEFTADRGEENNVLSPTTTHPAVGVSWYDAIKYCNWLSRKLGYAPCYRKSGQKETFQDEEFDAWEIVPDANGFRLP